VEQDEVSTQALAQALKVRDADSLLGGEASVAIRVAIRLDAGDLEWHDPAAVLRYQPADRADEAQAGLASPRHCLRPRHAEDHARQRLAREVGGAASFLLARETEVLSLRRLDELQLRNLNSHLARETVGRAGARRGRRTGHGLLAVGFLLWNFRHE